jgi:hypothetical protein
LIHDDIMPDRARRARSLGAQTHRGCNRERARLPALALLCERKVTTPLDIYPPNQSHPLVAVRRVAEHDYEVSCECGAQWRVRLEYDDDAMATCLAYGADTFELVDIGEVHSAGRDVEPI